MGSLTLGLTDLTDFLQTEMESHCKLSVQKMWLGYSSALYEISEITGEICVLDVKVVLTIISTFNMLKDDPITNKKSSSAG